MLEINKILAQATKESYPRKNSNEDISKIQSHYAEVSTDCEICAMRSKGHKSLKKDNVQECQSLPETLNIYQRPYSPIEDERVKVHITLTNKRVKVYGKWDKDKLIFLLSERLLRRARVEPAYLYDKITIAEVKPILSRTPYDPVIHRGIYNEKVLEELYQSGMTEMEIIRAMKFGLRNLTARELDYFKRFNVTSEIMNSRKTWTQDFDDLLFLNLKAIGLKKFQCQSIVLHGIISQNECRLAQLVLGGIDVPGILSWQGAVISISPRMIQFLKRLGIEDDILQLIVQKGIDEETLEMLKDLGYVETERDVHPGMEEVVTCECSLTIIESVQKNNSLMTLDSMIGSDISEITCETLSTKNGRMCFNNSASSETNSTDLNIMAFFQQPICPCHMHPQRGKETPSELIAQRNDYLRQNVMVPLVWAMSKALQYRPSDPKHYIAYKLLSWKYGNVSKAEMEDVRNLVITATIDKDKQLIKHKRIEEELELEAYKEALKNIPCKPCSQSQQLHRIKRGCWKCIKKWIPKYRPCELPEDCSSCEVDLSDFLKSNTTSFSSYDSSIPDIPIPSQEKIYSELVQTDKNIEKELECVEGQGNIETVSFSECNIHKEAEEVPQESSQSACCPWRCDLPIPDHYTEKSSKLMKELSRNKSNTTVQKSIGIEEK
ncbi:uncharacterized protein LOC107264199 [Cephus cinctus]|uniref:Uncharacterized protein LOC107264199 n=1 Tax=Cephus cinctus TaxID=211228 RepID=A0AAJ7R9V1_CEPCN|nr:uncharacterized protein LOC107264199 [Cephus cinctus]